LAQPPDCGQRPECLCCRPIAKNTSDILRRRAPYWECQLSMQPGPKVRRCHWRKSVLWRVERPTRFATCAHPLRAGSGPTPSFLDGPRVPPVPLTNAGSYWSTCRPPTHTTTHAYSIRGQRVAMLRANGTTTTLGYDGARRLCGIDNAASTANVSPTHEAVGAARS
jgi:YD repeat-containing protein